MSGTGPLTIALTGGTGLLGRVLVPLLLERGHALRCLVRPLPGRVPPALPGVQWVVGRLDEKEPVEALVRDADLVLHAAYLHPAPSPVPGRSDEEHWVRTNHLGSMRLLERTAGTRRKQLIYVSTLAVYGGDPNTDPLGERFERDEDFPLWPRDFYGAMRAGVEKMMITGAHAFGLNTSVFRLGCVLGMRDAWAETPFATTVDEAVRHGELRTTVGTYAIAVEDAARILADAAGDPDVAGGVYNTFDRWVDHAVEAAPLVGRLLGREVAVACPPASEPRSPIRNGRLLAARRPRFTTEEALERLLRGLVERRLAAGGPAGGPGTRPPPR